METHIEKLFQFISRTVVLSQEDKKILTDKLSLTSFAKGDVLLTSGQQCKKLGFVISGIYRVYKIENGKEITSYFNYAERNPVVAAFVSVLTTTPSKETIECIDPGTLLMIVYDDWKGLYAQSHAINTFGRIMAEFNYVLAMERIESLQHQSATDRYEAFLRLYPNLLNLIPHHYIASYLGITPESLSRIRKANMGG